MADEYTICNCNEIMHLLLMDIGNWKIYGKTNILVSLNESKKNVWRKHLGEDQKASCCFPN